MPQDEVPAAAEELAQRLAAITAERDSAVADLTRTAAERDEARAGNAQAIAAYRQAVVAGLPEPARALVTGDSIPAIDAAAATARRLVEEIAAAARSAAQAAPVPSGGATRQPPDLGALSATEKIRYGLEMRET
jgi:hypothetical protein